MNAIIKDTQEERFIEGIPRMEWGKEMDNSFIRSALLALNAMDGNYSYDFLMGISGAAFRLHFNPDWCPSSADSTTGFDVSTVLFKSLGYKAMFNKINDNSLEDIRALYHEIIGHIDKGLPIIAINLRVCPEWGIITGYLKNRPGIICRTFFDESEKYSIAEHAPWLSYFISKEGKPLGIESLFRNSLKVAVKLAKTTEYGAYMSGFYALGTWIDKLEKHMDSIKSEFPEAEVNWIIFNYLLDSRRSAERYLESMSEYLQDNKPIMEIYKKEVQLLKDTQANILPTHNSSPNDWTNNVIIKQIDVLKQVLKMEKEVIELFEKELGK